MGEIVLEGVGLFVDCTRRRLRPCGDPYHVDGRGRDTVQRGAEGLAHPLHPIEWAYGGEHRRGVRSLAAPRRQEPQRPQPFQAGLQEPRHGVPRDQARAELAQHGTVEAGVGEFKPEDILPGHTTADGLGRLAVGQVFGTLQDTDHGQSPMRGEPVGEVLVRLEGPKFVPSRHREVPVGSNCLGDAGGFCGHATHGVRAK